MPNLCLQCGKPMNAVQWMLGAVCGECCRNNHRAVVKGRKGSRKGKR